MEDFVFNEESLPFHTITDVDTNFPEFLNILKLAFQQQFRNLRVSESVDSGWFEIPLMEDLSLREWIDNQAVWERKDIKSFIRKTDLPQIPVELKEEQQRFGLSEFKLVSRPEIETPSLGAAYLSEQMSLSCLSETIWDNAFLEITHFELQDDNELSNSVEVRNCARIGHWEQHFALIEEQRRENLRKGNELWAQREEVFPNLSFCGDTHKQLTNLSISAIQYEQLMNALQKLDDYCRSDRAYSKDEIVEVSGLDISDESSSVKQKPKKRRHREYKIDGQKQFFGLHVKNFSGNFRLHFFPVKGENRIYVGYFGKHLPL